MAKKRKRFVAVYVEDLLIVGDAAFAEKLTTILGIDRNRLKVNLDSIEAYIGRTFILTQEQYIICMGKYILKLVERFEIDVSRVVETPTPSTKGSKWMRKINPAQSNFKIPDIF